MANVKFKGREISLTGTFPTSGEQAKAFTLCGVNLRNITLDGYRGKKLLLNIFPSVDTEVCALSVRAFNQHASDAGIEVLCISADLPFAAARFCGAEGIENVTMASAFRSPEFMSDYGVAIAQGPLKNLAARAVICIDEQGKVIYSQLVDDITHEPDYQAAMDSLK
ncbi:MAG: thiol peroxidase [Gammaproteobacteria bacterium]|nr:thiol peroxidase [Gammaproteobacteria bacterium]